MKKLIGKHFVLRRNIVAAIGVFLSIYFCYHLIVGQRGYFRLVVLETKIASVSHDYELVKAERESTEKKVKMMRPGSIDRDLLEERARHVLGYRHHNELILLQDRS